MRSIKPAAQKRPGLRSKKLWVVLILLVVSGGAGAGWYFWLGPGRLPTTAAAASTQTYTAVVRRGDLSISASGSGTLATSQTAELSFSAGGLVTELNVQVGDIVKSGDVLARVAQSAGLEASLAEAQLQRLQAQQSLDALQTNADLSLAQAYQSLLMAQATFEDAEDANLRASSYSRCSQAVATRYQADLDRSTQKLNDLTSADHASDAWLNARSAYDTALANAALCTYTEAEKTSAAASLEVARAAFQKSKETYNMLQAAAGIDPTELALAEAKLKAAVTQVAGAQEALAGLILTAPFDGKVISLAGSAGSLAGTNAFITLADVSRPVLSISLDENDFDLVVLGRPASVVFDVLPEQTFTGTVIQVDPQLSTSGQYKVVKGVVALDETSAALVQNLPLGLNAAVTLISQEAKDALLVPVAALKDLGGQEYAVMLVGTDGRLKLQLVQVGIQDGVTAQILSGLNADDVVSTGTAQAQTMSGSSGSDRTTTDPGMIEPAGGPPPDGMGAPLP